MIKLGTFGASDMRREFGVKVGEHKFDECVGVMHALGYDEGRLCHFQNDIVIVDGVEFVLKAIPGFTDRGLIEADIEVETEAEIPAARQKLEELFKKIGCPTHTDQSFLAYMEGLNDGVFPLFKYPEYKPGYFAETFHI